MNPVDDLRQVAERLALLDKNGRRMRLAVAARDIDEMERCVVELAGL